MGFFSDISRNVESQKIEKAMNAIGAYMGTASKDCESCRYYLDSSHTGSRYFGGCSLYGIKVFANRLCDNFEW